MSLDEIKKNHQLINLFVELAEIPSPSLKEKKLADKILEIFNIYGINSQSDSYGNVIAKLPATKNYKDVSPILLSAHMDVVGGSEPVNIRLSEDGKFIETDKTRTLGADNKAGVAAILDLAIKLNDLNSDIEHGPIEITFTRDEEKGMTGIRNLDTSRIKSTYAVICDGENLGELDDEGASFTNVYVKVHGAKGGHSGIDIQDETRVNAVKVISEFDSKIPQGVYKADPVKGVITSINAGIVFGGSAGAQVSEIAKESYLISKSNDDFPDKYESNNISETVMVQAAMNIINTEAQIAYSIRSSNVEYENELINLIKKQAEELNKKYSGLIKVDVRVNQHMKAFVKSSDDFLNNVIVESGKNVGMEINPSSFHAGAETHILANEKKNADNKSFVPVIVGLANLQNLHSSNERMDWESFLKGREWLEEIVINFARMAKQEK